MQSKNRRLKRIINGLSNPKSNSSKVAKGGKRLQIIDLSKTRKKKSYLTATGKKLKLEGADKKEISKHRKNRYKVVDTGKVGEKYIYHEL